MEYDFKVIAASWEKNMWNRLFINRYDGKLRQYDSGVKKHLLSERHKYVTIGNNGTAFGFANLRNMSKEIGNINYAEVWSISAMLVKEEYQHQGLARRLIEHVRDHHLVRVIEMTEDRAQRLKGFHDPLGFSLIGRHPAYGNMVHVLYDPDTLPSTNILHAANDNKLHLLQDVLKRKN